MAFVDYVKSVYQDQHKAKPKALTSVEEGKNVRVKKQAKERRSKRIDAFISNRAMEEGEDDVPLTPQTDGPVPKKDEVTDPRKKQMLLWKEERLKRKNMAPKKPPPFKVGVMRHAIAPLQEDIFKNPFKGRTAGQDIPCHRVTRSSTRAYVKDNPSSYLSQHQQKSFAPPNAKFHAPKVNTSDKSKPKLKSTPKKPKQDPKVTKLLTNFLLDTHNSKDKIKNDSDFKINKVKKHVKSNVQKMTKNNEKVVQNERSTRSQKIKIIPEVCVTAIEDDGECKSIDDINSNMKTPPNRMPGMKPTKDESSAINQEDDKMNMSLESSSNSEDLVISSPFVTFGRGKSNRKQESLCKTKLGYFEMSPEKTAQYFRLQLDGEIIRLQKLCSSWKEYQNNNHKQLMEDSNDLINLAIGQTQLLISKKFEQFRGLIVQCENQERKEGEGIVTPQDLQGFWDMVYMQVENVDVRFQKLDELKNKNWQEDNISCPIKTKKKAPVKTKPQVKNPKSSSGLKAMIQAARMKSKTVEEVKKTPAQDNLAAPDSDTITFNGGFFSVVSPVKNKSDEIENIKTPGKRKSMLISVIASEANKRLSTKTPPSTRAILKASNIAKNINQENTKLEIPKYNILPIDLNKTPSKSILKTPATMKNSELPKSNRKSLKVLFLNYSSDRDSPDPSPVRLRSSAGNQLSQTPLIVFENKSKAESEDITKHVKKRPRLTRQTATYVDENNLPKTEDTNDKTPNNSSRKRKSTSKKNYLDISLDNLHDNLENIIVPQIAKRRSRRKSQDSSKDEKIQQSFNVPDDMLTKDNDVRQSINLMTFSPQLPAHNTRYALRRKSTSTVHL